MTYNELLKQLEAINDSFDDLPEATRDTESLLRMEWANAIAAALRILRALAADEERFEAFLSGKPHKGK